MSIAHPTRLSARIWEYPDRTLTQTKFPFWSAIITQQQYQASVAPNATILVSIQPPAGQTWLIYLDTYLDGLRYLQYIYYRDYDGTTVRYHTYRGKSDTYTRLINWIFTAKILTNTLWGQIYAWNDNDTYSRVFRYGYSGFKLSKPVYSPEGLNSSNAQIFKRELTKPLPRPLAKLKEYACELFDERTEDYVAHIILEEDVVIARDPETGFPVDTYSIYVTTKNLLNIIARRDKPELRPDIVLEEPKEFKGRKLRDLTKEEFEEQTGYKKYFDEWRRKGIEI